MRATSTGVQYLEARAPDLAKTSLEETLLAALIVKGEIEEDSIYDLLRAIPADRIRNALDRLDSAGYIS